MYITLSLVGTVSRRRRRGCSVNLHALSLLPMSEWLLSHAYDYACYSTNDNSTCQDDAVLFSEYLCMLVSVYVHIRPLMSKLPFFQGPNMRIPVTVSCQVGRGPLFRALHQETVSPKPEAYNPQNPKLENLSLSAPKAVQPS